MTMEQAVRAYGWGEIANFARHLPPTSAVARMRDGETARFASELMQSAMLAEVCDTLHGIAHMYSKAHGGHPPKPKPWPRPWSRPDVQRVGSGAIPIADFEKWYYRDEAGGDS